MELDLVLETSWDWRRRTGECGVAVMGTRSPYSNHIPNVICVFAVYACNAMVHGGGGREREVDLHEPINKRVSSVHGTGCMRSHANRRLNSTVGICVRAQLLPCYLSCVGWRWRRQWGQRSLRVFEDDI